MWMCQSLTGFPGELTILFFYWMHRSTCREWKSFFLFSSIFFLSWMHRSTYSEWKSFFHFCFIFCSFIACIALHNVNENHFFIFFLDFSWLNASLYIQWMKIIFLFSFPFFPPFVECISLHAAKKNSFFLRRCAHWFCISLFFGITMRGYTQKETHAFSQNRPIHTVNEKVFFGIDAHKDFPGECIGLFWVNV